jgi:hypothetical protein
MHDILDRNTVIVVESCSSEDDDSDDEVLEPTGNANYNRAFDEFSAFERFKKKKYLPVYSKRCSRVCYRITLEMRAL